MTSALCVSLTISWRTFNLFEVRSCILLIFCREVKVFQPSIANIQTPNALKRSLFGMLRKDAIKPSKNAADILLTTADIWNLLKTKKEFSKLFLSVKNNRLADTLYSYFIIETLCKELQFFSNRISYLQTVCLFFKYKIYSVFDFHRKFKVMFNSFS